MDVLARAMWDKRLSFRQIARESFADAFGVDGARVAAWFERMSRLWEPMFEGVYASGRDDRRIARGRRNLPRLAALVDEARPLVKRNLCRTDGAVRWSWRYFDSYLELLDLWLPAMKEYLDAWLRYQQDLVLDLVRGIEREVHAVRASMTAFFRV